MSKNFDSNIHNRYLSILLMDIFKAVGKKLAFKGGTCAYFFYQLSRFSFDLDFDMLTSFDLRDMDKVSAMLNKHGVVKDYADKKHTLFYLFDYKKFSPKIKIEINKRVWKNNNYILKWMMGVPVKIADDATIFTNKLVALTDRKIPVARDLYDVYFFLKRDFPLNPALVTERTGKTVKNYVEQLLYHIEKVYTSRNILQNLGESLDKNQKNWAKMHLKPETTALLKKKI